MTLAESVGVGLHLAEKTIKRRRDDGTLDAMRARLITARSQLRKGERSRSKLETSPQRHQLTAPPQAAGTDLRGRFADKLASGRQLAQRPTVASQLQARACM